MLVEGKSYWNLEQGVWMSGNKGFALSDSLIAIAVVSLMMTLVSSLVRSELNTRRILQEAAEKNEAECERIYGSIQECVICIPSSEPLESEEPWQPN